MPCEDFSSGVGLYHNYVVGMPLPPSYHTFIFRERRSYQSLLVILAHEIIEHTCNENARQNWRMGVSCLILQSAHSLSMLPKGMKWHAPGVISAAFNSVKCFSGKKRWFANRI